MFISLKLTLNIVILSYHVVYHVCISAAIDSKSGNCIPIHECRSFETKFDEYMDGAVSEQEIRLLSCGFDYGLNVYKGKGSNQYVFQILH